MILLLAWSTMASISPASIASLQVLMANRLEVADRLHRIGRAARDVQAQDDDRRHLPFSPAYEASSARCLCRSIRRASIWAPVFGAIKAGNVGWQGATGALLERSLLKLRDLIGR
jgi:hypothetical protein